MRCGGRAIIGCADETLIHRILIPLLNTACIQVAVIGISLRLQRKSIAGGECPSQNSIYTQNVSSCYHCRSQRVGLATSPLVSTDTPRVNNLAPVDDSENPFYYTFRVQCTSCREIHPNWVSVSRFVRTLCLVSWTFAHFLAGTE